MLVSIAKVTRTASTAKVRVMAGSSVAASGRRARNVNRALLYSLERRRNCKCCGAAVALFSAIGADEHQRETPGFRRGVVVSRHPLGGVLGRRRRRQRRGGERLRLGGVGG